MSTFKMEPAVLGLEVLSICFILAGLVGVDTVAVVTPEFDVIPSSGRRTIELTLPSALVDCQVRIFTGLLDDTVLFLGQGHIKHHGHTTVVDINGRMLMKATYHGTGLANGSCGVELLRVAPEICIVQLRGRNEKGAWAEGFSILKTTHAPILASTTPTRRVIVVRPGDNVTVQLDTRKPMQTCQVDPPNDGKLAVDADSAPPDDPRYQFLKDVMARGQCVVTMVNVTEDDAGVLQLTGSNGLSKAHQVFVIVVAAGPTQELVIEGMPGGQVHVNDWLSITCTTPPSSPAGDITWVIVGGMSPPQDFWNYTLDGDTSWRLPWETQVTRRTLTYQAKHRGKVRLEFRVNHISLPYPLRRRFVLKVLSQLRPTPMPTPTAGNSSLQLLGGCPSPASNSLAARCTLSGQRVDCNVSTSVAVGAAATLRCRPHFDLPTPHPGFLTTLCTQRGRWSPPPFDCVQDVGCGRRSSVVGARQLSVGGTIARVVEFPWHVGIYFKSHSTSYMAVCGGSLVTTSIVISAAHCFWDASVNLPYAATLYKVAAGKETRSWGVEDEGEQRRDVAVIHLPENFNGHEKRLEADIAALRLALPVTLMPAVGLVCLDLSMNHSAMLSLGKTNGTVPGWGFTENNTLSDTLRRVDLPFVPYTDCKKSVPIEFQPYLTLDKVCGGFAERTTSVCEGDSGGGFVFPRWKGKEDRFFLLGVTSSSPLPRGDRGLICQAEYFSTFTLLSSFANWLTNIISHKN